MHTDKQLMSMTDNVKGVYEKELSIYVLSGFNRRGQLFVTIHMWLKSIVWQTHFDEHALSDPTIKRPQHV